MEKKIKKGSEEWQFFQDYYGFRQKYYEAEGDEWWQNAIRASNELYKKYENTSISEFAKNLIAKHMEDVDRRARKEMKK